MTDEQKKQMCDACPIPKACEETGYCVRNGLLTMPRCPNCGADMRKGEGE